MKKLLYIISIALAAIGCAKSEVTEYTPTSGEISLLAGVATRVEAGDYDLVWEEDDQIGVFTDQSGEKNLLFTIADTSTGEMSNDSGEMLFPLDADKRTYYAYYPYSKDQDNNSAISIDLTKGCSAPLLWATTTSNSTSVNLTFTHMLPKVTINLTAGGVEVSSLAGATATLKGAYAESIFSIESGTFSSQSTDNLSLAIDSDKIIAYLIPMEDVGYTVSDNVKLWITAGGDTYIYSLSTIAWESGSEYEYDITVGLSDIEIIGSTYCISSAAGLGEFAALVNSGETSISGKLMGDVDLGGVEWSPIGTSSSKPYTGNFDGGGYTISGLSINSTSSFQGLFGCVSGGSVSNLTISEPQVSGGSYTGAVCGFSFSSSSIVNCGVEGGSVSGTVTSTSLYLGGVVGYSSAAYILNCYNTADVSGYSILTMTDDDRGFFVGGVTGVSTMSSSVIECYNTGSVSGDFEIDTFSSDPSNAYIGGVVGHAYNLTRCYNRGDLSGSTYSLVGDFNLYLGGVVGYASYSSYSGGYITSCYSAGGISSTTYSDTSAAVAYAGGVLGSYDSGSNITGCYWNSTLFSGSGVGGGSDITTAKTTAEMLDANFVTVLNDGGSDWAEDSHWINSGYPIFAVSDND